MNADAQNQSGYVALLALAAIVIAGIAIAIGFYASNDQDETSSQSSPQSAALDSQLMRDVDIAMLYLNEYAANNNGNYPATEDELDAFELSYLPGDFAHPSSGDPYTIDQRKSDTHHLIAYQNGFCDEDGSIDPSGETRHYAIQIELSDGQLYCQDNS